MTNEDMWNELAGLTDSWDERGVEATKTFMLFTATICQFALINSIPLSVLYTAAYNNLNSLSNFKKDLLNFKAEQKP